GVAAEQRHLVAEQVLTALGVKDGRVSPRGLLASGTPQAILTAFYTTLGFWAPLPELSVFLAEASLALSPLLSRGSPPAFSGLPAIVKQLAHHGFLQGVGTADSEAGARRDLEALGLLPYFAAIVGSDHVRPKPHPDTVLSFARQVKLPVEQILVIGDSPADEAMARAAGSGFWGVLWGASRREDFADDTPVLTDPSALAALELALPFG
ncbi:MAG: HAD family hydrolase, partial [Spirochaetales bacterium]|nr:HAD family hydrolase [Spirochaetales bacterium]